MALFRGGSDDDAPNEGAHIACRTQAVRHGMPCGFATLPQQEVKTVENRFLDELNKKIGELFAASPAKDLEKNTRALLSSAFSRLDLVTREEFDVQQEVLARTREKLQQMEVRIAEMERSLAGKNRVS